MNPDAPVELETYRDLFTSDQAFELFVANLRQQVRAGVALVTLNGEWVGTIVSPELAKTLEKPND